MTINARKNQSNGSTTPTCKFCNTKGHTMAKCEDMIKLYEEVKSKPIEERGFKGNFAIQYIDNKKSPTTKSGATKKKLCGYCRDDNHTRKSCPQMVEDKETIAKANKVWRHVWSDFAKTNGLTPASLVKLVDRRYNYSIGSYENKEYLCTVGAELPENLNVFALGEDNKQQSIFIPMLGYNPEYGSNNLNARVLTKAISESMASSLFAYSYNWSNIDSCTVVAQSSYEFSDEWFDTPPTEDMDYALKKWSQEQMSDFLAKCNKLINNHGGDYGIS